MASCGLTLPCEQTITDSQDALSITNEDTGAALVGTSAGGTGVHGTNGAGSGMATPTLCGVWGDSDNAFGVHGTSNGAGVRGESFARVNPAEPRPWADHLCNWDITPAIAASKS